MGLSAHDIACEILRNTGKALDEFVCIAYIIREIQIQAFIIIIVLRRK